MHLLEPIVNKNKLTNHSGNPASEEASTVLSANSPIRKIHKVPSNEFLLLSSPPDTWVMGGSEYLVLW